MRLMKYLLPTKPPPPCQFQAMETRKKSATTESAARSTQRSPERRPHSRKKRMASPANGV
jgi:hypothetical protein